MSQPWELEPGLEPERYEFRAGASYHFDLDRREFLKFLGGGIIVLLLCDPAEAQESGRGRRRRGGGLPQEVGAWLQIGEDGRVTVYTGKAEVGQNIRTSLTQVVAEELNSPLDMIELVMADTQRVPYDAGTFGSRTTPVMAAQLRRASAAAREALLELAAEHWQSDPALLEVAGGKVCNTATGATLDFAQLTKGRQLTKTIAEDPATTPPDQWKTAGRSTTKVNGRAFVTGRHKYASDVKLPGMWHGRVLRAPRFGAQLAQSDLTRAEAQPDVVVVRDGDFIGAVAPTEMQAAQALDLVQAEWSPGSQEVSNATLFDHLKQSAQQEGGRGAHETGSIEEGMQAADVRLDRAYTVAYIAHFPLEPRAAVAQWEGDKLTVWTGTQRPFGVRSELAEAFGIPEENVRVLVPDTGSGYGGKHTGEAAVEAARLAKAAGRPVKLVWTREEEFTWAYSRPAGVIEAKSGVRRDGTLTAWEFHNYNSGASSIRPLYEIPHQRIQFHSADSPLRQGSYRALAATANTFARETHLDELAHELGIDPLDFRLRNLKDERLRAVLEAAAGAFGWGKPPEKDHGFGIAGGSEKGSYIATCAEVAVDPSSGRVQVLRAVSAFECGAVLNPDQLKNQVEGSVMMGLGGALFEQIEFADGRILNARLSRYRVPRFRDTPQLEVVLLDRKDLPSVGAGETPIIAIAPAIGSAIFAAAGTRLRSLPLVPRGLPS